MANRERGERTLVAGGVVYTLRLSTNASAELEDQSGRTFQQHVDAWTWRESAVALRWIVWACLQAYHATTVPTVQEAGLIIDQAENLPEVLTDFVQLNLEPLQELIRLGLLKPKPDPEGTARPPIAQGGHAGIPFTGPFAPPA